VREPRGEEGREAVKPHEKKEKEEEGMVEEREGCV